MNVVSAQVDHFKLKSGIHLQEVREIAGVRLYFYDLRVIEPEKVNNCRYDHLSPRTSHTIEHLLAHNLRQVCEDTEGRDAGEIVSVFPYGCLTGFGVISTIPPTFFKQIAWWALNRSALTERVPFSEPQLCGNYAFHNLRDAKRVLNEFITIIKDQEIEPSPLIEE